MLNSSITFPWQEVYKSGCYLWNCVFYYALSWSTCTNRISMLQLFFCRMLFWPKHPTPNIKLWRLSAINRPYTPHHHPPTSPPKPPTPTHTYIHTHSSQTSWSNIAYKEPFAYEYLVGVSDFFIYLNGSTLLYCIDMHFWKSVSKLLILINTNSYTHRMRLLAPITEYFEITKSITWICWLLLWSPGHQQF